MAAQLEPAADDLNGPWPEHGRFGKVPAMNDADREKRLAAAAGVALVEPGMIVGLGTGSTAAHAVRLLGQRVREGLDIRGVPTSAATRRLALSEGIPLTGFEEVSRIDLALDGTDEFDPELRLIKGGGGALLFEKIVACAAERFVVFCEAKKEVAALGAFPLPVEVIPFGWELVAARIRALGGEPRLRTNADGTVFRSDAEHYILDVSFGVIREPEALAEALDRITGVVEHGLFLGLTERVLVGDGEAVRELRR